MSVTERQAPEVAADEIDFEHAADLSKLAELEAKVERAAGSWVTLARTLRQIRGPADALAARHKNRGVGQLWRLSGSPTFTHYIETRFELSENAWGHLNRALTVHDAFTRLRPDGLVPLRQATAVLLHPLVEQTDEMLSVWDRACDISAAEGRPCGSQRAVRLALAERTGRPPAKSARTVKEREDAARAEGAAAERAHQESRPAQQPHQEHTAPPRITSPVLERPDGDRGAVDRHEAIRARAAMAAHPEPTGISRPKPFVPEPPTEAELDAEAERAARLDISIHELGELATTDPEAAARFEHLVIDPDPVVSIVPQSVRDATAQRQPQESDVHEPNGKPCWLASVCIGHESITSIARTLASMTEGMRYGQRAMTKQWLLGCADAAGDELPDRLLLAIGRAEIAYDRALNWTWPTPHAVPNISL